MLRVVELFAGIGAWSKALENLNIQHEIVYAVEFDEKTIKSYNILHSTSFETKDITKIDPSEVPDCDIILYSPPCQAFSVAGRQEGFADPRGTLFFDAFSIIKEKKPKYAVMENVKGLAQNKFREEFKSMLNLLEKEGYRNYWKVLNAKDFGIPQNRQRVFIVSIRNDIEQDFIFPQPSDNGFQISDLLEDEVEERYYISSDKVKRLLKNLREEDSGKTLAVKGDLLTRNNPERQYGFNADNMFTIRTAVQHGILTYHQEIPYIRKLTPLENIRFTGFDDADYSRLKENNISNSQIYKMTANSIVVNVVEEVLTKLLKP